MGTVIGLLPSHHTENRVGKARIGDTCKLFMLISNSVDSGTLMLIFKL